ncbi:uncharacterized protein SETTUDRAFT_95402 [Exserohilum turcica Et28A]|uniref:AAR2 protein n=1 Tax=Exserohilum turcicum (strain 28A) TaxID=671987 RepID=R0K3Q3_EXST2|nr:uncharacterized protein SETTUDRAFT_95402 [Exserohilum turcica Et28A]EOA82997.1 hypothetical protein SETTUDRAFT_95402 [Exserohilum turcica Et28A]
MITHFSPAQVELCEQPLLKILRRPWFDEIFSPAMDPSTISNCVLLLDLPTKALAGIDLLSFTTSPRFRGVKNVPPGLHFVFAAGHGALSVRHGAWFYVTPGMGSPQVFVKKWDQRTDDLVAETSQTELLQHRANLGSMWKDGLTPYRQTVPDGDSGAEEGWSEDSTDWRKLTAHITPTILSRICGLNPDHWNLTSASSAPQDLDDIPGLETSNSMLHPEKELRFLPIDLKKTWREGATGRERTEAAQDRSWFLGHLIDKHCQAGDVQGKENEILGELQFAFLMVLTLNNNSCLEQWKRLLRLLLTCRRAVMQRSRLFLELLKCLRMQLSHCADIEGDLFDMNDVGGGFLRPLLGQFRKALDDFDGKWKADLVDELDELHEYMEKEFAWQPQGSYLKRGMVELEDGERVEMEVNGADAEDEVGDYAPTIVDLTPEQQRMVHGSESSPAAHADDESEEEAELEDMDTRY